MTRADDAILEFYEETGIEAPPSVVAHNIDFSGTHVHRRIKELDKADLVEKVEEGKGYYAITERGRQYLAGEIDADELERDE